MSQLFKISEKDCVNCFACVRICPVDAIEVHTDKDFCKIVANRCIGCGNCLNICPFNAISYRSSKQEVKDLIADGGKIAAIVAPSVSGEFIDIKDYRKFVQMIKSLGFTYVCEVTFGVDLVAREYKKLFEDFKGKYFLSSVCPVVVSLVEKFYPELINNLVPVVSPMVATAKVMHKEYGDDTKVVYIGPCIASKDEAKRHTDEGKVDAVLTFTELRELFDEFDIKESKYEYSEFDSPIGYKGSILPIANGLLQIADVSEDLLTGDVITAEGQADIMDAMNEFKNHAETICRHFNLFFCEGCLMGPGTSRGGEKYLRRTMVVNYANKRLKSFNQKSFDESIQKHSSHHLTYSFTADDQRIVPPSQRTVREVLKMINKELMGSKPGCAACGFPSCQDFAVAVASGLAHPDMCLSFSISNRREYIETLKKTNEKLAATEKALHHSEKTAKAEQEAARDASETITTMMKKLPSSLVIVDKKLKIIHSNQSFIDLLGDDAIEINEIVPGLVGADLKTLLPYKVYTLFSQVLINNEDLRNKDIHYKDALLNISVFTIKKNGVVGAVIRDMYAPEVRKEEVVKRIAEAIDINLAMVQKIGFLLGEGAAETEHMLNSIIDTYKEG
ncbi:MAG: [Fe-Fe] hydrogenase large subunit C-terminal domain-containing protein [Bacteroidales bacterium]|nr:[Fe-Fe] hydrogenase large subunit C-terminal domain-containing protein [Bacteroidales bacterium]MDD4671743.1 [Fe-Fe] hydrogenase large subunit C-terminal domain-containing protein [Bacteroidales bacterium]MDY0347489.1 [Fe-Fe] hydrogenase large subunit C-terminal domain-containing protein [Tenuifilaceae bacterium]